MKSLLAFQLITQKPFAFIEGLLYYLLGAGGAGGAGGGAKCLGGAQPFITANIATSSSKPLSFVFMVDVFFNYNNQ